MAVRVDNPMKPGCLPAVAPVTEAVYHQAQQWPLQPLQLQIARTECVELEVAVQVKKDHHTDLTLLPAPHSSTD